MSFRLVPKSVTLNDLERRRLMPLILRYFTELVYEYDVVVKQLPWFQNLLLILYEHIKTTCAIIQRLFRQNILIIQSGLMGVGA